MKLAVSKMPPEYGYKCVLNFLMIILSI